MPEAATQKKTKKTRKVAGSRGGTTILSGQSRSRERLGCPLWGAEAAEVVVVAG
jgi:hypothetical protein